MENNNEEKVIIKYSSYTPAQKRATQKYRQNNKEKVNEQRKKYYLSRKEKDPEFLEYKRQKAKEYYQRKKASKEPVVEDVKPTPEPDLIIEHVEVPEEIVQVKPKRIRKKKETPKVVEEVTKVLETILEEPKEESPIEIQIGDEIIKNMLELKPKKKRVSKKKV